jgi:hypothetical protein
MGKAPELNHNTQRVGDERLSVGDERLSVGDERNGAGSALGSRPAAVPRRPGYGRGQARKLSRSREVLRALPRAKVTVPASM